MKTRLAPAGRQKCVKKGVYFRIYYPANTEGFSAVQNKCRKSVYVRRLRIYPLFCFLALVLSPFPQLIRIKVRHMPIQTPTPWRPWLKFPIGKYPEEKLPICCNNSLFFYFTMVKRCGLACWCTRETSRTGKEKCSKIQRRQTLHIREYTIFFRRSSFTFYVEPRSKKSIKGLSF